MRQPFSINAVIYRKNNNAIEYLLLKRVSRPELNLGDFWQTITGGVELGETIQQAACREVKEEVGLSILVKPVDFKYSYSIKPQWKHRYPKDAFEITEYVFFAQADFEPVLSDEHQSFGWFELEQALELMSFEDNKKTLLFVDALILN